MRLVGLDDQCNEYSILQRAVPSCDSDVKLRGSLTPCDARRNLPAIGDEHAAEHRRTPSASHKLCAKFGPQKEKQKREKEVNSSK